jgi:secreted Zn-dependent insulinase-like peptidase
MPAELFATHVAALIAKKREKDKNLGAESAKYWDEIVLHLYRFDHGRREIESETTYPEDGEREKKKKIE